MKLCQRETHTAQTLYVLHITNIHHDEYLTVIINKDGWMHPVLGETAVHTHVDGDGMYKKKKGIFIINVHV